MSSLFPRVLRSALVAGSTLMLLSCATPPPDASAVLARASQAMGADQLNTLRYIGEGTGYTFGQAYKPGGAWPNITLHSVTRSIDYAQRRDARRGRAEPRRAAGRRRLSAAGPAAQRPVRERRDRLEPVAGTDGDARARASSPTACTSSGSRRTAC